MASNQHKNLTGDQLHKPFAFAAAGTNTKMVKDGESNLIWRRDQSLPTSLQYVSPQSAPPTEVTDDIYLLDGTGTAYDINTITWQSGNTIRIAFNGAPDLSAVAANDYFVTSGNGNSSNDGVFQISAVDNTTKYFDIENPNRSDATDDEAADAVGTGYYTLEEWDGAQKYSQVRFNGTTWVETIAVEGDITYDTNTNDIRFFNGTDWSNTIGTSAETLQETITAGSTYSGGQTVNIQSVSGSDSSSAIIAPTAFNVAFTGATTSGLMQVSTAASLLSYTTGGNNQRIQFNGTDMTVTDAVNSKGFIYAADYSANFVARSLIDKGYADATYQAAGSYLTDVVGDTTPQLGGSLDVNGNKIVSVSNGDIDIEPNGTGNVLLGNLTFDADQTVGAGQDDYVLTYDNGTGLISLEAAGGGGSSLWVDNTNRVTLDTSLADMVEINDSTANTFSGTYTIGNLVVGNANTLGTFNVERVIVAGGSNTIAADSNVSSGLVVGTSNQLRDANNNVLFGNTNRAYDGSNNFASGNGNYVVGNRNIALGNGNFSALAGGPTTTDDTILIGSSNKAGGDDQILIGRNINCTFSGWSHEMIGFGLGANRVTAGFTLPNIASGRVNFCVGGYEGMRSTNGVAKTGAGEGLYYVSNYANTDIVEPSATIADATAFYAKDRTAGKSGFKMRVEDGTNHFFGDFSAIGGDETDANANTTVTMVGTSTGSGTYSMECEDSAGTQNLGVRDDGVVIMANLPTSSAGLPTGALWNNLGIINIA